MYIRLPSAVWSRWKPGTFATYVDTAYTSVLTPATSFLHEDSEDNVAVSSAGFRNSSFTVPSSINYFVQISAFQVMFIICTQSSQTVSSFVACVEDNARIRGVLQVTIRPLPALHHVFRHITIHVSLPAGNACFRVLILFVDFLEKIAEVIVSASPETYGNGMEVATLIA